MKRRMLSLLLTLVMVLGMLPATTMTANALMYIGVDTWEELVEELTTGDAGYIMLEDDIEVTLDPYLITTSIDETFDKSMTVEISGSKTLDLNGHKIEAHNQRNMYKTPNRQDYFYDSILLRAGLKYYYPAFWEDTLFEIPLGCSLTINDSGGDGSISYDAFLREAHETHTKRNVFGVYGTLIINDGSIIAGKTEKFWIFDGEKDGHWVKKASEQYMQWEDDSTYNGYARNQIWGSAVTAYDGGCLVVNGGELIGRGSGIIFTEIDGDFRGAKDGYETLQRDEVVSYQSGSSVIVNGGSFKALGGANVFDGTGDLTVRAGFFKTDKHDNVVRNEYVDHYMYGKLGNYVKTMVQTGSYGHLGIPDSAWKDEAKRMQVFVDNAIYNGNAAGKVELDETGGQTSGESLQVTIVPYLTDKKLPVTLSGGPYSNYPVSDGQVIDWNVKSDNLVATVDYDPYFADTTGLKNAAPVYTWHLWGHYGTNGEVSEDIVTTTGELDISAAWEEAAGTGNFRTMKVSCVVSEAPTNCAYRMETKTYEFRLDPTKTPLDESSLPGGEMEVDISYPAFSGLGSDIVVTVKPSAEDLADAAYGSSTVRYEYLYRDNMEEWEDEPHAWPHNTYNIPNADWGHVKIDVTMRVYGSDGLARRFHKSAWALKLPDITVSGASLNSDKTAYVGNPGSPVTLKAPIDVTNADIAADRIVASDIAGLYRVTYDNSGKPVMSLVTAGSYTQYQVTGNGTYCYAAYDRDGNLVYSKPVKVVFSAELTASASRSPTITSSPCTTTEAFPCL